MVISFVSNIDRGIKPASFVCTVESQRDKPLGSLLGKILSVKHWIGRRNEDANPHTEAGGFLRYQSTYQLLQLGPLWCIKSNGTNP
jgi:hypothetical protein